MTTPTAKEFRKPLLRVLGQLSNWTVDAEVQATDTYDPVMALMGIPSVDHYGVNEASGQPAVIKWIQWANTALRRQGLTGMGGRGSWTLTSEGLAAAQALETGASGSTPTPPVTPVVTPVKAPVVTPVKAPATATVIPLPKPKASAPVAQEKDEAPSVSNPYADDYIMQIASEQTPCFGSYSDHGSAICRTCPLQDACRNQSYVNMSLLAKRLLLPAPTLAPTPAPTPTPDAATQDKFASVDWKSLVRMKANLEENTPCLICQGKVNKGDNMFWLSQPNLVGLVHVACAPGV